MNGVTTAFWGMVINNPDEKDMALVHNGYPDHMREMIYTHEQGANGTPHIQAWIKLQRQQRMSFCKKLFPRANFKSLTSDEYMLNAKRYAQKLDETAQSAAVHTFQDPMKTIENVVKKVISHMIREAPDLEDLELSRRLAEREMVVEDYKYAKIFVSTVYTAMWKKFGHEMYKCVFTEHTHTHTHTPELISVAKVITTDDGSGGEDTETDTEESAQEVYESDDDDHYGTEGDERTDGSDQESDCS